MDGNVFVHSDSELEALKQNMLAVQDNVAQTLLHLEHISEILFHKVYNYLLAYPHHDNIIPVYVLRGGLIMKPAFESVFGLMPSGCILPVENQIHEKEIVYLNLPAVSFDTTLILIDLILNTGITMASCAQSIMDYLEADSLQGYKLCVVAPFATNRSLQLVRSGFPYIDIHTAWADMAVGSDERLREIDFDAGDYAFGGIMKSCVSSV